MASAAAPSTPIWRLLRTFSWQELRHHGIRHATAMLAVLLGVALAFSVHLINESALAEFSSAVRTVSGQADLSLHAARGGLDEALNSAVDVKGEAVRAYADRHALKPNTAAVRVKRAREALRQRVAESCGTCAEHGCRDCSCGRSSRATAR